MLPVLYFARVENVSHRQHYTLVFVAVLCCRNPRVPSHYPHLENSGCMKRGILGRLSCDDGLGLVLGNMLYII